MAISENRKWSASWMIPSLITLVAAVLVAWTGLEMTPLIVIISICWIFAVVLLWILTPGKLHKLAKILASVALTAIAAWAIWWVYSYDRPILQPEIGGLIIQNFNDDSFALDVEALVRNDGRQSAYADKWGLKLVIDGAEMQGKELFGQSLPPKAVSEPGIADQEFPPGRPVRGWLFFAFPGASRNSLQSHFLCNSQLMDNVTLKLSVWDSKDRREWTQVRALRDLGKEACIPLQVPQPSSALPTRPESSVQVNRENARPTSLVEADRLAIVYRAKHPEQLDDLDAERKWVNRELAKEGFAVQNKYFKVLRGYVPSSQQCPAGIGHISNSTAEGGKVGFEIQDPCVVLDSDHSINSETGFRFSNPQ